MYLFRAARDTTKRIMLLVRVQVVQIRPAAGLDHRSGLSSGSHTPSQIPTLLSRYLCPYGCCSRYEDVKAVFVRLPCLASTKQHFHNSTGPLTHVIRRYGISAFQSGFYALALSSTLMPLVPTTCSSSGFMCWFTCYCRTHVEMEMAIARSTNTWNM